MCGIAGMYDIPARREEKVALLYRMLNALEHRGPDECGLYLDEGVGLASARLSIQDVAHGGQPVHSPDRRYWLVFNGELFNFVELRKELEAQGIAFETRCDTEVVLNLLIAQGPRGLEKMNGQFAIAFYDRSEKTLLLARDRFGERPLFFARRGKGLYFGSEVKALFQARQVERKLDPAALRQIYQTWTTLPGQSCFAGVEQVPPGSYMIVSPTEIRRERYYSLPAHSARDTAVDIEEARRELRARLRRAVSLRLRSDVEVAVFLSGGLDSSIVCALARDLHGANMKSYSVAFEDADFDESEYQEMMAAELGLEHRTIRVAASDIEENFEKVVYHAETPQFRAAPTPMYLLSNKVHDDSIKVVLTGEGADEAFLGYNIFKEVLVRRRFKEVSDRDERAAIVAGLYPYLAHFSKANAASVAHYLSQHMDEKVAGLFSHETRFSNGGLAVRLLRRDGRPDDAGGAWIDCLEDEYPGFIRLDDLTRAQLLEYKGLLAGYLLSSQGDRMLSANSVEGRTPFLDHDVVDFAFSLPKDIHLTAALEEKALLKQAFADIVPKAILSRPKTPYRTPDAACFVPRLKARDSWTASTLSAETLERSTVIDAEMAERFLAKITRADAISPRESQAFMLMLSTLALERRYIHDFRRADSQPRIDVTRAFVQ